MAPESERFSGVVAPRPSHRLRPVYLSLAAVSRWAPDLLPRIQKNMIKRAYQHVNRRAQDELAYLNYGYASLDGAQDVRQGGDGAPAERFSMQLYGAVTSAVDLSGTDVLEVGCGRGGGSAYLCRRGPVRSVTGVDFSSAAAPSWKVHGAGAGARFAVGDAERLPFPSSSFDVVVNVESSHCYPRVDRFLGEVWRVLRVAGSLVFADLRSPADMVLLKEQIVSSGFVIYESEVITANVVRALELDTERRLAMMAGNVPRFLHGVVRDFMGVEGSEVFDKLRSGQLVYERLAMNKM